MSGDEFAGLLVERITVERRATDRDAGGGASGAWAVLAETRAAIVPAGLTQAQAGDALDARSRWRVTLRVRDVGVGDRLVWRGCRLSIVARLDDPRAPDRLELACEEEDR